MTVAELLNKKVQKDAYPSEDVWPRNDQECGLLWGSVWIALFGASWCHWMNIPPPLRLRRGWECIFQECITVGKLTSPYCHPGWTVKFWTPDSPSIMQSVKADQGNGLQEWAHCFFTSLKWYTGELMAGGNWKEIGKFHQFFWVLLIIIPVESNNDNH